MQTNDPLVLVTGAAGQVGSIGRTIVRTLITLGVPVRAFVRSDDERAESLRQMGAEVFVGDLLSPRDVTEALKGCRRVYFGMSLSPSYADATIIMAAACKAQGDIELLCNMSDYEQVYMTLQTMAGSNEERIAILGADVQWSPQQRAHWASEQALDWSGLPVVHIKAAMFVENPITLWLPAATVKENDTIRLPFGQARTAPVATVDVAAVCVKVLVEGSVHAGKSYELTGPTCKDWHEYAEDVSAALGREIKYVPTSLEEFESLLKTTIPNIPEHNFRHLMNLAIQNRGGRYVAEVSGHIEALLGRPATSFREVIEAEAWRFERGTPPSYEHRELAVMRRINRLTV